MGSEFSGPKLVSKCSKLRATYFKGYRTKRVGFVVTFRLFGAEKSVLKLVGANLKDGQNVLVLWRLFGLLVRENPH